MAWRGGGIDLSHSWFVRKQYIINVLLFIRREYVSGLLVLYHGQNMKPFYENREAPLSDVQHASGVSHNLGHVSLRCSPARLKAMWCGRETEMCITGQLHDNACLIICC